MTRPKADSDPWLTDMVSRDREIAKTVVYGIREIVVLLRGIRDGQAEEIKTLTRENARLRNELIDAYRSYARPQTTKAAISDFPTCEAQGCALPQGHFEAHRGSIKSIR
jgi:hypothetical protein